MTVDIDRAEALLHIAAACTDHSGKLSNLQAWAIGELIAMNAEIKAEATKKADEEGRVKAEEARKAAESQQAATGLPAKPKLESAEDDHSVDPAFGAPRAVPATELGGDTTTQVDRRV